MSTRLVQLKVADSLRVAIVEEGSLHLLTLEVPTIHELATRALRNGHSLSDSAREFIADETLDYEEVYSGAGSIRILPPATHPSGPAHTLVSGTGLTHQASVERRNAMHAAAASGDETDSMRLFREGMQGGRPKAGDIGTAPEWFYKGNGSILRGHGDALTVPAFAEDGGEEPEIAGVYLIDSNGAPRRLGFAVANEFSDHVFERRNYLYLAHSKLRECAIGPELIVEGDFQDVQGEVRIERNAATLWSSPIRSGEANMCHSLANIEHHHFKYAQHRIPSELHVHFFGADAFSFGSGMVLQDGDVMEVQFAGFGRPLRNPLRWPKGEPDALVSVKPI